MQNFMKQASHQPNFLLYHPHYIKFLHTCKLRHRQILAFKIKLFHGKQALKCKIICLHSLYILYTAALHAQQLEELRDTYVKERDALLLEASREKQRIISGATYNEELLQTISFKMLNEMETWTSVWKETYELKTDEVKTNVGRTGCVKLGSCWVLY